MKYNLVLAVYNSNNWELDEILNYDLTLEEALFELEKKHKYYIQTGSYDVDDIYENYFEMEDFDRDMPNRKVFLEEIKI
jgi:hypothetical protein